MIFRSYTSCLILLVCVIAAVRPVLAQDRCATVELTEQLRQQRLLNESDDQFERWITERKLRRNNMARTGQTYQIPVVVHVIHKGEAIGSGTNIPDAQVISQISVLNKDFNRLNADASSTPPAFAAVAASLNIEFVLAKQTPDGTPTTGIVRVKGSKNQWDGNSSADNSALKAQSYWPAEDYLNMWVTDISGDILGYAQFPVSSGLQGLESAENNRLTDGVVIDYRTFGSTADGAFNLITRFSNGRTATHEVGHFFGLRHIWGDDNTSCTSGTDYVTDTPNQGGNTTGCPANGSVSSCSVTTMFQNYMDYTDDGCMNLFTTGQVSRMETVIENSPRRVSLLTSIGAYAPVPVADIAITGLVTPGAVHCNSIIQPVIQVYNAGVEPVTSFKVTGIVNGVQQILTTKSGLNVAPGDTSQVQLPIVTLREGVNTFSVTLSETNRFPDIDNTDNAMSFVTVVDTASDYIPLRENFDDGDNTGQWITTNPAGATTWNKVSTNYGQSLYFNGQNGILAGDEAWLVSPVLDFSAASDASMFYDLSYVDHNAGNKALGAGHVAVKVSRNCGETYEVIAGGEVDALAAAREVPITIPASPAHWNRQYVNLNSLAGEAQVRVALVLSNGRSNGIYLDNIEFFLSDNPAPLATTDAFVVYGTDPSGPSDFYVTFNLEDRQDVVVYDLIDINGRQVAGEALYDVLNQTFTIAPQHAPRGLYLFRLKIGKQYYTTRVLL